MTILKMNPEEYSISAEYAPLLLKLLERYNVTEEQLLADVDATTLPDLKDPAARLPLNQFQQVVRRAMELAQAPWLGWEFGATLTLSSHPQNSVVVNPSSTESPKDGGR